MTDPKQNPYPARTAGRLMITNVPTVSVTDTIGEVEKMLSQDTTQWDTVNYVYVLAKKKLRGVISIKEILQAKPTQKIADLMNGKPVTARTHTDQIRVVYLALQHNLKAVPIIDKKDHFLGIVPSDVILDILNRETAEDILRTAGIHGKHDPARALSQASAFTHLRKRLPWLVLGIIGGLGAAILIDSFEQSLERDILLAAFIPTIVYIADSVGSQAQTLFIRSLVMDDKFNLWHYLKREFMVTLGLASSLATIIGAAVTLFWHTSLIGIVLAISVFSTICIAIAVGIGMPLFFSKIKLDPAIASGPLATIIRDLISILVYFTIAQALIA